MANYQVISRERHATQRWQRYSSYAFAASDAVVPLTAVELPKAVLSLPIGFIEQAGAYTVVAVLGLQPGQNLLVGPNGAWAGGYIPAGFRGYPFRLAQAPDAQQVLCIDEDSGLVSSGPEGEAFFTDDGEPSQAVRDFLGFLNHLAQGQMATQRACAALQKHQLIRPWAISVKTDTGEQQIAGLFQIDEAALMQLQPDALHELMQAGALPVAYCQLLSIQNLPLLGQLAQARAKAVAAAQAAAAQAAAAPAAGPLSELDLEFLKRGDTISLGNLF